MIMNLVEVKEFSFAYPECSRKVLDHANLKIEEGTLNVICGRSGCGNLVPFCSKKYGIHPTLWPHFQR